MRYPRTAAATAKSLLSNASKRLLTADPAGVPGLSGALDEALDWSIADTGTGLYRPFEPSFSETSANNLSFLVSPGGAAASVA